MEQIIETIKRIEKARTALRQAMADNEIATSPKLKDLNLIPKIYKIFEELKGKEIKVNDRKEFIFVVIYLYSYPFWDKTIAVNFNESRITFFRVSYCNI